MTVKVTLEFPSIEASIAALGLLMKPKAAATATNAGAPVAAGTPPAAAPGGAAPSAPATAKRERKPRSDAGKPRGEYGPRTEAGGAAGAPSNPAATTGANAAPVGAAPSGTTTEPAAPQKAPVDADKASSPGVAPAADAAGPQPSEKDAQEALEKLFNATTIGVSQEVMSRFGIKRLKELPDDRRAEFVEKCNAVTAAVAAALAKANVKVLGDVQADQREAFLQQAIGGVI